MDPTLPADYVSKEEFTLLMQDCQTVMYAASVEWPEPEITRTNSGALLAALWRFGTGVGFQIDYPYTDHTKYVVYPKVIGQILCSDHSK